MTGDLCRSDPMQQPSFSFMAEPPRVVVWGGPARHFFHGVLPLKDGEHPAVGRVRYNLTLRAAE